MKYFVICVQYRMIKINTLWSLISYQFVVNVYLYLCPCNNASF